MTATINASTSAGVVTTADTSGILQLQTNGTAALTVDASQNVGIGTASPTARLTVASGTNEGAVRVGDNATYYGALARVQATDEVRLGSYGTSQNLTFYTVASERMRINASGEVFIGGTTQGRETNLSVDGTYQDPTGVWAQVGIYSTDTQAANKGGTIGFGGQDGSTAKQQFAAIKGSKENSTSANYAGYMAFFTRPNGDVTTERARILSTGQVLIDRTTNTANGKLEVYGDSDGAFNPLALIQGAAGSTSRNSITFYRVSAGANVGTITTTNTATAYNTSSDYRLKEAIAPMTGALAKVALLKPCTYKWKIDGSDGQGFIAHELAEVVEGCVSGEKDAVEEQQYEVTPAVKDEEGNTVTEAVMGTRTVPSYQGIDTSFLVATLTAAIQELKAIVDAQGAEIAALKGATA
jgi:hypothetical protein